MKFFAVIVAGGSGTRMNSEIPKQFLLLNGKPVIMHTIAAFFASIEKPEILVVLNRQQFSYWEDLCELHQFKVPHQLVAGGETRFHSVKNALEKIDEDAVVAIHDAVRPLINTAIISNAYQQALKTGNAVVAVPSKDSVRWQKTNGETQNLNRSEVFLVQTPQTFQSKQLKKAYEQEYSQEFTDDASVVERSGEKINLIEGNPENFKITFPADLRIAEMLLNEKSRM
ncbi:MAG: 2-C-methyl-D-erythritol 4-phosphate cytidylyltransferase [Mucilaginibacter sp.]|uniref:2-C-methyl-D-erythritol 4-phosphate cytidylyltransferase n=1 Tax=Mucilaginibacter sp. TaxID=1882438 RepID=UPI0034E60AC9